MPTKYGFHCCLILTLVVDARESMGGIKPLLYADNLKSEGSNSDALFDAARISKEYILLLDTLPPPNVQLSTCASVRSRMKSWVISGYDDHCKVEFDVRNLGGHVDTTLRGQAGTVAGRI